MAHQIAVINEEVKADIARVIDNANWNPIEIPEEIINKLDQTQERIYIDAEDVAPTNDDIKNNFSLTIPEGIGCIYTHEEQPGADIKTMLLCRHLSIRSLKKGSVISPEIVKVLAKEFKFNHELGEMILWWEDDEMKEKMGTKNDGLTTIHILEPVEGSMDQMKTKKVVQKEAIDN